jgi:hypothetical protein
MRNHFHRFVTARPKAVATREASWIKRIAARAEFLGCFVVSPRNDDTERFQ